MNALDPHAEPSPTEFARLIDHTLLRPEATRDEVDQLCDEAKQYDFFSVCVHAIHVERSAARLAGSTTTVCSVVGFPLSGGGTAAKLTETDFALASGAREIDMVIPIGALKSGDHQQVLADVEALATRCHQHDALLKVILETCLLTEPEKQLACELSIRAGADFLKTSTGFSSGGATVRDVQLLRAAAGPKLGVKAAGGIGTIQFATELIRAGATRLGCSRSVDLMRSLEKAQG